MALIKVKESVVARAKRMATRVLAQSQPTREAVASRTAPLVKSEVPSAFRPAWALGPVKAKVKRAGAKGSASLAAQQARKPYPTHQHRVQAQTSLKKQARDPRFAYEREKMESVENLAGVADDVEDAATLLEWQAREHGLIPQSLRWYILLAVGVTAAAGVLVFLGNFMGAVAVAFVGVLLYVVSQRKPGEVRYRIMVDGIAINDRLYQYQDLAAFNIVYEPGQVKTVMVRSKKMFSPLIQMEIGEADPVEIRDVLLEYLREDLNMQEPLTDMWARRLGF